MKNNTIKFVLLLSVLFNVAFLGTLGYRLLTKRPVPFIHNCLFKGRPSRERHRFPQEIRERLRHVQSEFPKKLDRIHPQLFKERKILIDLLKTDTPDSLLIEQQLDKIVSLQKDIEKEIVYQLLREKNEMPPELREQFLDIVAKRLIKSFPRPGRFPGDREERHENMKHKRSEEEIGHE